MPGLPILHAAMHMNVEQYARSLNVSDATATVD